nr:hypothetical protein [Clostridia bacterium]
MKQAHRLLSILLILAVIFGMVPATRIAAATGITPGSKPGSSGKITFTVDDAGVLTWSEVPGAASYDLTIWTDGGLFKTETGNTSRIYDLRAQLDKYKRDSGTVEVSITPDRGSEYADSASFLYASPYPKLEAPAGLHWNGMFADWDDVPGADGYVIYLYQSSGSALTHYDVADSYFNCVDYPAVANLVRDGWYFTVKATSSGNCRDSAFNESPRKGSVPGDGVRAESKAGANGKLTFTVDSEGVLTWSAVSGATGYDVSVWTEGRLFRSETGNTSRTYDLQGQLNQYRKDSGTITVDVTPQGVYGYADRAHFLYASPYGKLEAPTGLRWNGSLADWNDAAGADSYTIWLYQPSGSAYSHWTTAESSFDLGAVADPQNDWYFKVQANSASGFRDSVFNESPRKTADASSQIWLVGTYAYDETLDEIDSGGQVYMQTSANTYDWSNGGYTEYAVENTAVTVKAQPAAGYEFVEWRQGTKGAVISADAAYSFTCTGSRYLYAVFRQKGAAIEIREVNGTISAENVPRAGMEVEHFMPNCPAGEHYTRAWNGANWRDENGVLIAPSIRQHYDIGYEFEAGRTYTTDGFYFEASEGYVFADEPAVTLTGPDPSMWTYEITGFNDARTIMHVRFTFTIPGEREYPDIDKVSMVYSGMHAEGAPQSSVTELIYNNCTLWYQEWNTGAWGSEASWDIQDGTGEKIFKAGETYVHMIELRANDGYRFSESLIAQKGRQGYEEIGAVTLSADRTVATVSYTYTIAGLEYIDPVVIEPKGGNEAFCLMRQGGNNFNGVPFTTSYTLADAPYKVDSSCKWYDAETDEQIRDIASADLELGRRYRLEFFIEIKDEYETACRFGQDPSLVIKDYQYAGASFLKVETSGGGGLQLKVSMTYTVQPRPGEGGSAQYPLICYTYNEFKYAMERADIRYVALGNVEDMLPAIPHDEETEPGSIRRTAIVVRGHKDLNLLGNAVFRCPLTGNYDLKYYVQLLTLTDAANSSLYVHGEGSLTYEGGTLNFVNSVIEVDGGYLCVDGAAIRGSNGYHTGFCYGINARWGSVAIQNGATVIGEVYGGDGGVCALVLGEEGENRSLSVSIFDGKFYVERDKGDGAEDYGIGVWNDCGLRIYGMSADGIELNRHAAGTLAGYVASGCTMTVNGVQTDPASCGTTGGYVEVYQKISKVGLALNAPEAGKAPAIYPEDVYWVPEGCAVESVTWYENGELWDTLSGAARFTAGSAYRVEIVLIADGGLRFADPLESAAINHKNASVSAHGGNREKSIVLSADLGECAAAIGLVELTVTAPKEGNVPSYTVGTGSEAYYAAGGSSNYTDYRRWYESSDGDEWWEINRSSTFKAGYYYKFYVDILARAGFEFPLYDNGSIMPDVSAIVNGYYGTVHKAYEQDPSRCITVEYNFGECSDSVVERITVENVTAPAAGQKPDYNWSVRGTGYYADTAKNAYYDDWMHDRKLYYIKNGIRWMDVTGGGLDDVYENETFIPGHEYEVWVYVRTEDDFEFAHSKDYEPTVTATINGMPAEAVLTGGDCAWSQRVERAFTCIQPEISIVSFQGLSVPQAGKTPDTDVTSADPALYEASDVRWLDEEGGAVSSFEQGHLYTAEITVAAKDYDGADGCVFTAPLTAYVDGKEVSGTESSVTVNPNNTVTIRCAFRKGASGSWSEIYAFTAQPKGGTAQAGESLRAAWTTNFVPDYFNVEYWDGEMWDQWDCLYAPASGEGGFGFESGVPQTVRFRVAAFIGDAAAAISNEFTIT